jgi:hypothetical protein
MADIFSMLSMELLLPFFLVLAVVYGALEVSNIFRNRAVKAIIAAVFAFFSIMNSQVVSLINSILPYAAAFFVLLFLAWIVIKPFRGGGGQGKIDPVIIVIILGLILILIARLASTGYISDNSILSNTNLLWIVGIAIALIIFYKVFKIGSGP